MENERLVTDLVAAAGRFTRAVRRGTHGDEGWSAWRALAVIDQSERTTVGLLGQLYGCSQPAATKIAARLTSDGFITRRPDPDDARASLLEITDKGRQWLISERTAAVKKMGSAVDDLTADDVAALTRSVDLLNSMAAALVDDE